MKTQRLTSTERAADTQRTLKHIRDNELILLRCNLLNPSDQALIQMVYERGGTFQEIARLTGQSPSTVRRRFHKILKKLLARELTALMRQREEFDSLEIRIGRAYFLEGLSQRAIADKLGVSAYRVRGAIQTIRHIIYCTTVDRVSGKVNMSKH